MQLEFDFQKTVTISPVVDGKEYKVFVSELVDDDQLRQLVQLYDNLRMELAQADYERRKLAGAIAMTKQQLMVHTNRYVCEKYGLDQEKEQPDE